MTTAIIFPGQGSQSIGMLSDLAGQYDEVKDTFKQASKVLKKDLWKLCQEGPAEELNATVNTQPVMLAAGVAVWRVWLSEGGTKPQAMAGHSLGEYTALVCAGVLDFEDALRLVAERARLMQEAVPEGKGAMAAVLGLENDVVRAVCEQAAQGEVAEAVNYNSPGQVVIAGDASAIERAIALATEAGASKAIPLPVSVPSHCSLMRPAADKLAKSLEATTFNSPKFPIIHNVDAKPHPEPDHMRKALAAQLYSPVLWVGTIRRLAGEGAVRMLELGPGRVLTGLTKRIDRSLAGRCVHDIASLEQALSEE
jgi:[acyl-carrier-protein] S-malonyltransferase